MNVKEITREDLEKFYIDESKRKFELIENTFYQLNKFTQNLNGFFAKNNLPFSLDIEVKEKSMNSILGRDSQEDMILPKSD